MTRHGDIRTQFEHGFCSLHFTLRALQVSQARDARIRFLFCPVAGSGEPGSSLPGGCCCCWCCGCCGPLSYGDDVLLSMMVGRIVAGYYTRNSKLVRSEGGAGSAAPATEPNSLKHTHFNREPYPHLPKG